MSNATPALPGPAQAPVDPQAVKQPDQGAILRTAILLLEGLSHNVMSGDVWALSILHATARAEEMGINKEEMANHMDRLMKMVHHNRKANPMSSMF